MCFFFIRNLYGYRIDTFVNTENAYHLFAYNLQTTTHKSENISRITSLYIEFCHTYLCVVLNDLVKACMVSHDFQKYSMYNKHFLHLKFLKKVRITTSFFSLYP